MKATAGDRQPNGNGRTKQNLDPFAELTATAWADETTAERRAGRLHRLLEQEASTLVGILIEAAERRRPIVVDLPGLSIRGTLTAVGADFAIVFSTAASKRWIIRTSAVTSLTCDDARMVGDRTDTLSSTFQDLAAELAGLEEQVDLLTTDGAMHSGVLEWCGVDLLAVGSFSGRQYTYIPIASLSAMSTP
jgi:hypothetical protein